MNEEQKKLLAEFMRQIDCQAGVGVFNSQTHKGMWVAWVNFRTSIKASGYPSIGEYQDMLK